MNRWRGWWLLWSVPFFALAIVLEKLFGHSRSYIISAIPMLVGATGGAVLFYRGRHGFWPWDFKRRKIERWSWLVTNSPGDRGER